MALLGTLVVAKAEEMTLDIVMKELVDSLPPVKGQ